VAGKKERRKTALVAVAHRMVRIMHAMLRTGEVYRPTDPPAADEPLAAKDQVKTQQQEA